LAWSIELSEADDDSHPTYTKGGVGMSHTQLGSLQVLYIRSALLLFIVLGWFSEPALANARIKLVAAKPQALSVRLTWNWRGARSSSSERLDFQWSNCNAAYVSLISFSSPPSSGSLLVTAPATGEYCFRARAGRSGRWIAHTRRVRVTLESLDLGNDIVVPNPEPTDGFPQDPPPKSGNGWLVAPTVQLPDTILECPVGFEEAALLQINAARSAASLPPLQYSRDLWIAARMHSSTMALNAVLSHDGWDRIFERTAFGWIAQNIAVNIGDGSTLAQAWLESPPHRASILDGRARFSGIACVVDAKGAIWSTQYLASAGAPSF